MTIRQAIKNMKFKTERFVIVSNNAFRYDFFLSDLECCNVEEFVPTNVLDKEIEIKRSYKKDGVENILLICD